MEITLDLIVFTVLAVFTLASAVLAVTTKRILRAATFLLFVLFGTAGIYFQLNYSFLGAVQLLIYAGGTIKITTETVTDEETGKPRRRLVKYEYDLGACMFCHLCVNACPHDAIRFDTAFEHAVYTRDKLVKTLNK